VASFYSIIKPAVTFQLTVVDAGAYGTAQGLHILEELGKDGPEIGQRDQELERKAKHAKKLLFDTCHRQKKKHWTEFLADHGNIWQAAKYLDPSSGSPFAQIPELVNEDGKFIYETAEIARTLLHDFFPPVPGAPPPTTRDHPSQLEAIPLTKEDVRRAIFAASPRKAPGLDGIPRIVWRELWPILQDQLLELFQNSLNQSYLPLTWRTAKIVPLRKGG